MHADYTILTKNFLPWEKFSSQVYQRQQANFCQAVSCKNMILKSCVLTVRIGKKQWKYNEKKQNEKTMKRKKKYNEIQWKYNEKHITK